MTKKRREKGQSLVEFTMVFPIFLLIVFAIVDFGMGLRTWISVTNSAREGARYAAVTCATNSANVANVMTRVADTSGGIVSASNVTVTNCPGNSTESVVVAVTRNYTFVTPLAGIASMLTGGTLPTSLSISSSSDMRLE